MTGTRPRRGPAATAAGHTVALARDAVVAVLRRYHRLDVTIDEPLPAAPALIVSNHGFGGIFDRVPVPRPDTEDHLSGRCRRSG